MELRRRNPDEANDCDPATAISVWLQCPSLLGLVVVRKKIGHVPLEIAELLEPVVDESATLVGRGTVQTVYAPMGRDEAVVTVEIVPLAHKATKPASGMQ